MTSEEICYHEEMESAEIEAEIRAEHPPSLHLGEPCPAGCCACSAGTCEVRWALHLLDRERAKHRNVMERLQFNLSHCPSSAGSNACPHMQDSLRIVNKEMGGPR